MSIARDLVALEEKLRKSEVDLFAPIERGDLLETAEANMFIRRLESLNFCPSPGVMRLCLQALRVQYDELSPRITDAELVATLPPEMPGIARPTGQVLREMLRPQVREVILLGYEVTDHETMRLLVEAAAQGADVIMICDRERRAALKSIQTWPADVRRPRVYHDRERTRGAPFASMHAKCLLVDGRDLLITSANFTFHGLHGNIEIGVRLSGSPAGEARKIFSHLVESGVVVEAC